MNRRVQAQAVTREIKQLQSMLRMVSAIISTSHDSMGPESMLDIYLHK